jgi:hypothetical protein
VCDYPRLIAAYHALHRLLVPRHPPYTLSSLTPYGSVKQSRYPIAIQLSKSMAPPSGRPLFIDHTQHPRAGGDERNRTADPLLAKQVLSHLSYIPTRRTGECFRVDRTGGPSWDRTRDLTLIKRAL